MVMMMNLKIPGIRFVQSEIPLQFTTDGTTKSIQPAAKQTSELDTMFFLSDLHYELFNLRTIPAIKAYSNLSLPDKLPFPSLFDGSQNLAGKKILLIMLTGWGDTILIEPVVRAFFHKHSINSIPPEITIAGNWIKNFPYKNSGYVRNLVPNILTVRELMNFDVLINFIPSHLQRVKGYSLQESYADLAHIRFENESAKIPSIMPDQNKVKNLQATFDQLRLKTGKKLLFVNWISRFHHKNAPAELFAKIIKYLPDYQAVTFNEQANSSIINEEINRLQIPLINLSSKISDYHDTIAALSLIDAFISVDTGVMHAAGALKIPGVALFGPFPPETLIFCYPSIKGLSADFPVEKCTEACLETHRGCRLADYRHDVISHCFQSIKSSDVIELFKQATSFFCTAGEKSCVF